MDNITRANESKAILTEFLNNLNKTNLICRDDIISLESQLQSNLLTKTRDINYYSMSKTSMYINDIKKAIEEEIHKYEEGSRVTYEMAYELMSVTNRRILRDLTFLAEKAAKVPSEVLDIISNDKYMIEYAEDETGSMYIANNKDRSFLEVLATNNNILGKISEYCKEGTYDIVRKHIVKHLEYIKDDQGVEPDLSHLSYHLDYVILNIYQEENLEHLFSNLELDTYRPTLLLTSTVFKELVLKLPLLLNALPTIKETLKSYYKTIEVNYVPNINNIYSQYYALNKTINSHSFCLFYNIVDALSNVD